MESVYLNEYVSFEKLNQWLKTLKLTKDDAGEVLEKALNDGVADGSLIIPQSYLRRQIPDIQITLEEKRVDDRHVMYRMKEDFSTLLVLVIDVETMTCVIIHSFGNGPSFNFMSDPRHIIMWEDYLKGR